MSWDFSHSFGDSRPFVGNRRQDFGRDAPSLAIEELFVEVPHQRLVKLRNGLERDSSSACPQTEGLHFLVTGPPGSGAKGGPLEKGLLSVATRRRAHVAGGVACATPPGARDQTLDPSSLQAKFRTENAASRRDASGSDWAVPRPAGDPVSPVQDGRCQHQPRS